MSDQYQTVIFGGGASLGAHQVGAMRLLEERGVQPSLIIGSSIGVINAMAYVSGGLENLERMWKSIISWPHLIRPSLKNNPLFGHSLFKADRLYKLVEQYWDYQKVMDSSTDIGFIVTNMTRCREEMMTSHQMTEVDQFKQMIRAAITIPILYPLIRWKDQEYCDGGFGWNVPLEYAVERESDEIYVLSAIATKLPRDENVGRNIVSVTTRFMSLLWRNAGNATVLNAKLENGRFFDIPTFIVNPREEHSGFTHLHLLHVHPKKSEKLMEDGYEDARKQIARQERKSRRLRSVSGDKD